MTRTAIFVAACLIMLATASTAPGANMELLPGNAVRDCAGRKIIVEKAFSRIISLYGAHTENIFHMGGADQLIGVSRADGKEPAGTGKPVFSPHDGPERFLALNPDLVIVRPMIDRGYAPLMERLEQFGVRVVSLQPGNIEEMRTYWQILGRLTGKEAAAKDMIARFDKGVETARSITADITHRKKVYFEAIHLRFKTFSPGAMPLFVLDCAGGINLAGDALPVRGTNIASYGKERILSHAGEMDVYIAQKGVMNRIEVAEIVSEPGYQVIRAVREGSVYVIDEEIVSRPTLRLLEGICEIGEILYPERFDSDARQKIICHEP